MTLLDRFIDHTRGEDLPWHVAETLSWQVLAELVRRHPGRLWIQTETHSIGSERGVIIAFDEGHARVIGLLGLPGTNATSTVRPGGPDNWRDFYRVSDPRDWLLAYEAALELPAPVGTLPASTPASLAVRWVATFLRLQLGGRRHWTAGGPHRWGPSTDEWHGIVPRYISGQRAARPYPPFEPIFVGSLEDGPRYAVTTDGELWSFDGLVADLAKEHIPGRSMMELVVRTAHRDVR